MSSRHGAGRRADGTGIVGSSGPVRSSGVADVKPSRGVAVSQTNEDWIEALNRLTPARDAAPIALLVQRLRDEGRVTPAEVVLDPELGVVGDRWASGRRGLGSQVTLMRWDVASLLQADPAQFGDNLFAALDTSRANLPPGTVVIVGSAR